MSKQLILLFSIIFVIFASNPLILISPQNHNVIYKSEQLIEYLSQKKDSLFVDLGSINKEEFRNIQTVLKALPISKQRVSSFFINDQLLSSFKEQLNKLSVPLQKLSIEQLVDALLQQNKDIIIGADIKQSSSSRLLQTKQTLNSVTSSSIFNNMTNASASGLWVGLFLLVMLGIALSILFNLKTHDKFARQNLWVGRQS